MGDYDFESGSSIFRHPAMELMHRELLGVKFSMKALPVPEVEIVGIFDEDCQDSTRLRFNHDQARALWATLGEALEWLKEQEAQDEAENDPDE